MIKGTSFTLLLVRLSTGKLKFFLTTLSPKLVDKTLIDFNLIGASLIELWDVRAYGSSDSYVSISVKASTDALIQASTGWVSGDARFKLIYEKNKKSIMLSLDKMWWGWLRYTDIDYTQVEHIDVTNLVEYFKVNKFLKSQTSKM